MCLLLQHKSTKKNSWKVISISYFTYFLPKIGSDNWLLLYTRKQDNPNSFIFEKFLHRKNILVHICISFLLSQIWWYINSQIQSSAQVKKVHNPINWSLPEENRGVKCEVSAVFEPLPKKVCVKNKSVFSLFLCLSAKNRQ